MSAQYFKADAVAPDVVTLVRQWTTRLEEFRQGRFRALEVMRHLQELHGQAPITMTWCGVAFPITEYDNRYYQQRVTAAAKRIYDEIVGLQRIEISRWDGLIEGAEFRLREAVKAMVRS